jgi:hypothetical protein
MKIGSIPVVGAVVGASFAAASVALEPRQSSLPAVETRGNGMDLWFAATNLSS